MVWFQGKEKGTAMNETTWKFLSPLNSSAGNRSTPVVAQKFPPFQCCFRRSNEVPRLLVLFRNYRLIIGCLRLEHCLPRLFCSHRKAWDNIYPDRLHVGAEGWGPTPPGWLEAHGSEGKGTGCCPLGSGDRWGTAYSLTEQLILNVEVKAEVEFKEQPEGA